MDAKNIYVIDNNTPAAPGERVLAFIIDYAIAGGLAYIPYVGIIISALYLLTRDGLPFLKNRSVGKIIMKQRVIIKNNPHPDLKTSFKRNIIFLPNLLAAVPGIGPAIGFLVLALNFLAFAIEAYLMFTNSEFQRLGDQFADTYVIKDEV